MKKFRFTAVLTTDVLRTALTGCGVTGGNLSGRYVRFDADHASSNQNFETYKTDPDTAIDNNIQSQLEYDYSPYIQLDSSKFEYSDGTFQNQKVYSGTVKSGQDDTILLKYSEMKAYKGLVTDNNFEVFSLKKQDTDNSGGFQSKAALNKLNALNENGSFSILLAPRINAIAKNINDRIYPPVFIRRALALRAIDGILNDCILKKKGDFICIDTYGLKLDGSYKAGNDFSVTCDINAMLTEDKNCGTYSLTGSTEGSTKQERTFNQNTYDKMMSILTEEGIVKENQYVTKINFSGGKWEWYTEDGSLINNGVYYESQKHPGLIVYTWDETSQVQPEEKSPYQYCPPLMIYIADNGNIYYPCYIKT